MYCNIHYNLVNILLWKNQGTSSVVKNPCGSGMPGHRGDFPPITFVIDKWTEPTYAFWMLNGVSSDVGFNCTTKNCGFRALTRKRIDAHIKTCSDQVEIIPKCKVYGYFFFLCTIIYKFIGEKHHKTI